MFRLSLFIGKLTLAILRLTGRGGGTALPGLIALRIDPEFLTKCRGKFKKGIIVITGTNGKTTTAKLVADAISQAGFSVLANPSGSNLKRGIVAALVEGLPLSGKSDYDYGLFEIDEAALPSAAEQLQPSIVTVTNLFRDQLDRYGELDYIAGLIKQSLLDLPQSQIILNADDPLVATLGGDSQSVTFFGISDTTVTKIGPALAADSIHCPICDQMLTYEATYFGHLGIYNCPQNHFSRPQPAVTAAEVKLNGLTGQSLRLTHAEKSLSLSAELPGLYNTYNLLTAFAVTAALGIDTGHFQSACQEFEAAFGRMEKVAYLNRWLYLLLIKNPTGFNQVIDTVVSDQKPKHLLIAINDKYADGRDISWLWDVNFEALHNQYIHLTLTGTRSAEIALRLKYASLDFSKIKVIANPAEALAHATDVVPEGETLYVMPTYTAMFDLRQSLVGKVKTKNFWEA